MTIEEIASLDYTIRCSEGLEHVKESYTYGFINGYAILLAELHQIALINPNSKILDILKNYENILRYNKQRG